MILISAEAVGGDATVSWLSGGYLKMLWNPYLLITGEVKASDAIKRTLARRTPAHDDIVPRLSSGARPFVLGGRLVLPKFGGNRQLVTRLDTLEITP